MLFDTDPQATLSDVVDVRRDEGFKPQLRLEHTNHLDSETVSSVDEVVIDIGVADMPALHRALELADRVVVPVPPSQADIWSAQRFLKLVKDSVEQPPEIYGFINRGDTHRAVRETDEAAAALVSLPGIQLLKPRLGQRTVFRRSFSEGLAVFELESRSKGAKELLSLCAVLYPHIVG
jgi:chromosome partitioning protein